METVGSTNAVALELAEKDAPHGTVVVAHRQTKGRGRLGRTWVSPSGNIYMSIILKPPLSPADAPLLTMTASVACARALRETTGLLVGIKWPNDLMVLERKLGGILTEVKSRGSELVFAVIGIGVNLNSDIEEFPPDIKEIATSVRTETGQKYSRNLVISRILDETEFWYDRFMKVGREGLLDEWRHLTFTLGKKVIVVAGEEMITGVARDIDKEGRLIVELVSGGSRKISAGDVKVLG